MGAYNVLCESKGAQERSFLTTCYRGTPCSNDQTRCSVRSRSAGTSCSRFRDTIVHASSLHRIKYPTNSKDITRIAHFNNSVLTAKTATTTVHGIVVTVQTLNIRSRH
ncbi:unnamed protein product [Laminaria digitata]